jgi:hypothetical protein
VADHFWLQDDDANKLILDSTVQELTLGGNKRAFKVVEFLGAAGGFVRGFGNVSQKKFIVTRTEKIESGDETAFNSRRFDFTKWFSYPRWKNIWFYILDGESSITMRTKVYAVQIPEDKYKYYHIATGRSFMLVSPKGIFENTTADTDTEAITSSLEQTVSITNDGIWDTPIKLKFTPTGNETVFQVRKTDNFSVRLEGNFNAGDQVVYDTADNSLTIDGVEQNPTQYITSGSVFNIDPGTQDLYVKTSGAGTFAYEFNERYS